MLSIAMTNTGAEINRRDFKARESLAAYTVAYSRGPCSPMAYGRGSLVFPARRGDAHLRRGTTML